MQKLSERLKNEDHDFWQYCDCSRVLDEDAIIHEIEVLELALENTINNYNSAADAAMHPEKSTRVFRSIRSARKVVEQVRKELKEKFNGL